MRLMEKCIKYLNQSLDPFTIVNQTHADNCKCYVCTNILSNEITITRVGYFDMSDEIFLRGDLLDLTLRELSKKLNEFIRHLIFKPYNLHYRCKKTLSGIRYEFFRVSTI